MAAVAARGSRSPAPPRSRSPRCSPQAQQAFEEADAAYRKGDTVLAAEKTEEARGHIEDAFALLDAGDATDGSGGGSGAGGGSGSGG